MNAIRSWLLPLALTAALCGCSTVDSGVYTRGAIQARLHESQRFAAVTSPAAARQPRFGTVKVNRFTESRARRAFERHNLWLAYIPLACVGTYWDRSDWMLWQRDQEGYKPVGLDMAEALQAELEESGLFGRVLGPQDEGGAEWVIDGDVPVFALRLRPHLCGGSVALAPCFGILGLPLGTWRFEQRVKLAARAAGASGTVWEQTFDTSAGGSMAAYYGRNPMQFGYPYEALMAPVAAGAVRALPQALEKARQAAPAAAK